MKPERIAQILVQAVLLGCCAFALGLMLMQSHPTTMRLGMAGNFAVAVFLTRLSWLPLK